MQFGNWFFNKSTGTLDYTGGVSYQIPLWEMKNSAETLDWIYQVEEKTWASAEDVGNLVKAIVELFGRGVCGGGLDHPFDAKQVLQERYGVD